MAKTKSLAEEIFGGVSDFHGYGYRGKKPEVISEEARERFRNPRYHEVEQVDPATMAMDDIPVTEKDLSPHY